MSEHDSLSSDPGQPADQQQFGTIWHGLIKDGFRFPAYMQDGMIAEARAIPGQSTNFTQFYEQQCGAVDPTTVDEATRERAYDAALVNQTERFTNVLQTQPAADEALKNILEVTADEDDHRDFSQMSREDLAGFNYQEIALHFPNPSELITRLADAPQIRDYWDKHYGPNGRPQPSGRDLNRHLTLMSAFDRVFGELYGNGEIGRWTQYKTITRFTEFADWRPRYDEVIDHPSEAATIRRAKEELKD